MKQALFSHGSLRLYLLSLLAQNPMHGYELIQALTEKFGGTYVPSAGTIYPRLAKLNEEGFISKESHGRKTIYSITQTGLEELNKRQSELDTIEDDMEASARRRAEAMRNEVSQAMKSVRAELAAAAQSARREARKTGSPPEPTVTTVSTDPRASSRQKLKEIDALLAAFHQEVRADLRSRSAKNGLPDHIVDTLRNQLAHVKKSLKEGAV
ncbi:PadR family transcriptional regulator [Lysinibacter sp. HNR]|uniref:PadR family transcriptional regulator n=1 Tax=Lysinibacter sp. HNR TaxID=3031408 RepID=UPI00243504C2|nr:PadR family transcriptional regulator [Lysinibacter sp. HNR]WGD36493.1 PadR family transcriptional regulator [Lysinibacter sp. HNR]